MLAESVSEPLLRDWRVATVARNLQVSQATVQLSFADQDALPEELIGLHEAFAHLAATTGGGACALHAALLEVLPDLTPSLPCGKTLALLV